MKFLEKIDSPTLLVDVERVRKNLEKLIGRAEKAGSILRPHYKTHQSIQLGRFIRAYGIDQIAVSSVDMAEHFVADGWKDVQLAIPFNLRQLDRLRRLCSQAEIQVVAEHPATAEVLCRENFPGLKIWIEIDTGQNRSGIKADDRERLDAVADALIRHQKQPYGVLTHAGQSYGCRDAACIDRVWQESTARLRQAKNYLEARGFADLKISAGDTPAASVAKDLSIVDELRPGNFIYYDLMQAQIGACAMHEIAVAVACPVLSVHPSENKVIIYGGAVHLSKDRLTDASGKEFYGKVIRETSASWENRHIGTIRNLSQEHGWVEIQDQQVLKKISPGDLILVHPVHSCLTANLLRSQTIYFEDGEIA